MTTHYRWTTAWPHALPDITAHVDTTEDPAAVTCPACRWALGTQKHAAPREGRS